MSRESLPRLFLEDMLDDWDKYGWKSLIPTKLGFACVVGAGVGWVVPADMWRIGDASRLTFFVGLATVNGLLLALSWNAFGRIYDSISRGRFSLWLYENKLLAGINFQIRYIQMTISIAVVCSVANMVLSLFGVMEFVPISVHRVGFALGVGSSAYAMIYAIGSVGIMQDVVESQMKFVNSGGENVVRLNPETKQS